MTVIWVALAMIAIMSSCDTIEYALLKAVMLSGLMSATTVLLLRVFPVPL